MLTRNDPYICLSVTVLGLPKFAAELEMVSMCVFLSILSLEPHFGHIQVPTSSLALSLMPVSRPRSSLQVLLMSSLISLGGGVVGFIIVGCIIERYVYFLVNCHRTKVMASACFYRHSTNSDAVRGLHRLPPITPRLPAQRTE